MEVLEEPEDELDELDVMVLEELENTFEFDVFDGVELEEFEAEVLEPL